jgi:hypothetical protein
MESKSPKNSTKKTPKKAVAESPVASKAKTPKSTSKTPAEKTSTAVPTVGEHRMVNMNQVRQMDEICRLPLVLEVSC